jgi:sec-independent protein translocase protein TatC
MSEPEPSMPGGQMTLIEHLTELRHRLVVSVIAVAIGMAIVGGPLYQSVQDWLLEPYQEICDDGDGSSITESCDLLQTDPVEGLSVRFKVAAYGGIALAMPVLLWQVWRFVNPGLYAREKRYAIPFVVAALILFVMGAGIAYWTLPRALDFLGNIGGDNLTQGYSPGKYFQLVTYMMLAFGAGFEFPILLIFLQLAGILQPSTLSSGRRYAYVLITVLVADVTPSGDPFSMLALSVPMVVFYEIAIVVGRVLSRRREAQDIA